jgi:glucose-1-phosphatase
MEPLPRIETVIFDLGNVLLFHDNRLLFRRFGEEAGLSGSTVEKRLTPMWEDINRGTLDGPGMRKAINQALGLTLDESRFFELWNCHFKLNSEVLPWVEALGGKVKRVLLSNTNSLHAQWFRPRVRVLEKFDHVLLSHELGLVKPEREFYEAALERSGTAPENAAFFDDIEDYVLAARALGIHAQVFSETKEFPAQLNALGLGAVGGSAKFVGGS